jgi:hypothetical protein
VLHHGKMHTGAGPPAWAPWNKTVIDVRHTGKSHTVMLDRNTHPILPLRSAREQSPHSAISSSARQAQYCNHCYCHSCHRAAGGTPRNLRSVIYTAGWHGRMVAPRHCQPTPTARSYKYMLHATGASARACSSQSLPAGHRHTGGCPPASHFSPRKVQKARLH